MKGCILAAGQGKRMGPMGEVTHKGLLPLGNQAVISHIIRYLGEDLSYVVAVAPERGDAIRDYLALAHPGLTVEFMTVEHFEGPGSGPGQSLHECRHRLQEPFYFVACDTIVTGPLPGIEGNWLGVREVDQPERFCTVVLDREQRVTAVENGGIRSRQAFVGLAFVKDYGPFWEALDHDTRLHRGEKQVNQGLAGLIPHGLRGAPVEWVDTGTEESYRQALTRFEKNYTFHGKTTDITYRIGDRILKYFKPAGLARKRFERGMRQGGAFVEVLETRGCFFSMRFINNARLFSTGLNHAATLRFLEWAQATLWRPVAPETVDLPQACKQFYADKTCARLADYAQRFPGDEGNDNLVINGRPCQPARVLVGRLLPAFYASGVASGYHGDLHGDNILIDEAGNYRLIDWRDAFGPLTHVGDLYYDLAKFLHTLELSVEVMEHGAYELTRNRTEVRLEHRMTFSQWDAMAAFEAFMHHHGYDLRRVRIIDALIFLNMAPLYDDAMAAYLYHLGRYLLQGMADQDHGQLFFRAA
ncbi:MAG: NTP transferase domain-containing protein [Magnetococcales bacterium]|nr:NTP transferase domain-containing protein [Magnetococcales bacterium]MBF0150411.1 NTP transferase domain-containing protein [Magnetococcales bacterium]MBF0346818.1 NTP transferase domain-containing protein [Magnetococcales bacterium]MBF0632128.1 NTP transferase domain-containing protein [Magnetococcales bacterium]